MSSRKKIHTSVLGFWVTLGCLVFASTPVLAIGGEEFLLGRGRLGLEHIWHHEETERERKEVLKYKADAEHKKEAFERNYKISLREAKKRGAAFVEGELGAGALAEFEEAVMAENEYVSTRQRYLNKITGEQLNPGRIIARTFAGSDFAYFDTSNIQTWDEGLKHGMTIATARAFAKLVQSKIEGVFNRVLGSGFDKLVDSLVGGCVKLYREVFHAGKEPFNTEIVGNWRDFINTTFSDIEKVVKDGLRDALRGHDMATRTASLLDDPEALLGSAAKAMLGTQAGADQAPIDAWSGLMSGYAQQFDRIRFELEIRKGFYDQMSREAFFASQIQAKLKEFAVVLLNSATLTDLDAAISSNKAVIPAFRNNIENLFKQLLAEIKPRSYSFTAEAEPSSSLYARDKRKSGYDDYDGERSRYPLRPGA